MNTSTSAGDLFISLSLLNTRIFKQIDFQLSVHGISFTEFMILRQLSLSVNQTMPRIELARSLGISASGVTRLLAPMEKLKLVDKEKNPRDARMSLVKLSRAGLSKLEDSSVTFFETAGTVFSSLTRTQLERMDELIDRIR